MFFVSFYLFFTVIFFRVSFCSFYSLLSLFCVLYFACSLLTWYFLIIFYFQYLLCFIFRPAFCLTFDCVFAYMHHRHVKWLSSLKPLSAKITKWSNTLKQFVGNLPTNFLSVFDHFVGLALKGLNCILRVSITSHKHVFFRKG